VAQITSIGCNIRETNIPYGVAVILGSVLAVVLFMLLIPFFGKEGAAAATLFSNMFIAWFLSRKAQRLYPVPYDFESFIFIITLLTGISVVANYTTNHLDVGLRYLIKSLFFIGYIAIILLYYTYVKKIFLVGTFFKQLKKV